MLDGTSTIFQVFIFFLAESPTLYFSIFYQFSVKLENYQAAIDSFEKALEMAKAQKDRSAESAIRKAIDEVNRTIKKKERGASASDRGNDTDRGDETDHGNETDGGNETDRGSNHDRHSSSDRHSSAESTHEGEILIILLLC